MQNTRHPAEFVPVPVCFGLRGVGILSPRMRMRTAFDAAHFLFRNSSHHGTSFLIRLAAEWLLRSDFSCIISFFYPNVATQKGSLSTETDYPIG